MGPNISYATSGDTGNVKRHCSSYKRWHQRGAAVPPVAKARDARPGLQARQGWTAGCDGSVLTVLDAAILGVGVGCLAMQPGLGFLGLCLHKHREERQQRLVSETAGERALHESVPGMQTGQSTWHAITLDGQ